MGDINTFGSILRLTTFGESHGAAVGAVVDGCPAGIQFDLALLKRCLKRRRPGSRVASSRKEPDLPEVLSGVFEGRTTGAPIAVVVRNKDQRSRDYDELKNLYRPSHADYTYAKKYGHRDHRGGGRSSARETLCRVVGGAVARMIVQSHTSVEVVAAVTSIGTLESSTPVREMSEERIYASSVRCDDTESASRFTEYLERLQEEGDSTGGIVSVAANNVPPGFGDPVYAKLHAMLAGAMMSVNGATGFEMGAGFRAARRLGSENNDQWGEDDGELVPLTNNSGGVQGGISNGNPIEFRVSFKPPSSIAQSQSHGTKEGGTVNHTITGRHDPSIVVRAVPVVEAMTWLTLADALLRSRIARVE